MFLSGTRINPCLKQQRYQKKNANDSLYWTAVGNSTLQSSPKSGRMQTGAEAREGYKVESESIRGRHDDISHFLKEQGLQHLPGSWLIDLTKF